MDIDLEGIVIIVGNYGSGKTEVAVNLAMARKKAGIDVRVADLDLVNPYFRTREARAVLARKGIEVVLPPEKYLSADLPIVSPAVSGMIRRPSRLSILDVGGDKFPSYIAVPRDTNPYLGWRGLRLLLRNQEILKTQMRAILRASHFGKASVLYPVVSGLEELRMANMLFEEVKSELAQEKIPAQNGSG